MDKFLSESQAQGVTQEGVGEFTLSLSEALRKLSEATLPSPEDWILKLVQAAVASGADEFVVKLLTWHTEVRFAPPSDWTGERVLAAMGDPRGSGDAALDHLVIGLRALAVQAKRPFRLNFGHEGRSLVWDGDKAWVEESAFHPYFFLKADHIGSKLRRSPQAKKNLALLEKLAVEARCCPLALEVDGRRLDALMDQGPEGNQFIPLFCGEVEGGGLPDLPLPLTPVRQPGHALARICNLLQRDFPIIAATGLKATIAFSVVDHAIRPQPSQCHWIRDGVIVDSSRLPLPTSRVHLVCFASAVGMETDLSGFSLRENEKQERLKIILENLGPVVEELTYERVPLKTHPVVRAGIALGMSFFTVGAWGFLAGVEELDRRRQNRRFEQGLARLKSCLSGD